MPLYKCPARHPAVAGSENSSTAAAERNVGAAQSPLTGRQPASAHCSAHSDGTADNPICLEGDTLLEAATEEADALRVASPEATCVQRATLHHGQPCGRVQNGCVYGGAPRAPSALPYPEQGAPSVTPRALYALPCYKGPRGLSEAASSPPTKAPCSLPYYGQGGPLVTLVPPTASRLSADSRLPAPPSAPPPSVARVGGAKRRAANVTTSPLASGPCRWGCPPNQRAAADGLTSLQEPDFRGQDADPSLRGPDGREGCHLLVSGHQRGAGQTASSRAPGPDALPGCSQRGSRTAPKPPTSAMEGVRASTVSTGAAHPASGLNGPASSGSTQLLAGWVCPTPLPDSRQATAGHISLLAAPGQAGGLHPPPSAPPPPLGGAARPPPSERAPESQLTANAPVVVASPLLTAVPHVLENTRPLNHHHHPGQQQQKQQLLPSLLAADRGVEGASPASFRRDDLAGAALTAFMQAATAHWVAAADVAWVSAAARCSPPHLPGAEGDARHPQEPRLASVAGGWRQAFRIAWQASASWQSMPAPHGATGQQQVGCRGSSVHPVNLWPALDRDTSWGGCKRSWSLSDPGYPHPAPAVSIQQTPTVSC